MNISKSVINYAKRRGIDIVIYEKEYNAEECTTDEYNIVVFFEEDNDCEWMFSYKTKIDVSDSPMFFNANVYLDDNIIEELPNCINNEKHLKEMINFLSTELKNS